MSIEINRVIMGVKGCSVKELFWKVSQTLKTCLKNNKELKTDFTTHVLVEFCVIIQISLMETPTT